MRKFVPKIPPRISQAQKEESSMAGSLEHRQTDAPQATHQENIVLIRVKRRRDEVSKPVIVIGRDDSERDSKRIVTAEDQMSRLTVGESQTREIGHPIETKVFKLIGTVPMSSPLIVTGKADYSQMTHVAGDEIDPSSSDVDTVNILKRIKEHCKLRENSRNVKRESTRQPYFDVKVRARYYSKHKPPVSGRLLQVWLL